MDQIYKPDTLGWCKCHENVYIQLSRHGKFDHLRAVLHGHLNVVIHTRGDTFQNVQRRNKVKHIFKSPPSVHLVFV